MMTPKGKQKQSNQKKRRLIEEDGVRRITSNPSIFEKAIADSHDYDDDIRDMALNEKVPRNL